MSAAHRPCLTELTHGRAPNGRLVSLVPPSTRGDTLRRTCGGGTDVGCGGPIRGGQEKRPAASRAAPAYRMFMHKSCMPKWKHMLVDQNDHTDMAELCMAPRLAAPSDAASSSDRGASSADLSDAMMSRSKQNDAEGTVSSRTRRQSRRRARNEDDEEHAEERVSIPKMDSSACR